MDFPGQLYMILRLVIAPVLFMVLVLWQYMLEPRLAYFRNRGDYFNKALVKAKFMFLLGLIIFSLGGLILPIDASLFFGSLLMLGGVTYLVQAMRISCRAATSDPPSDQQDDERPRS